MRMTIATLFLAIGSMAVAQNRDFLTAAEIDQLRLTQEPNARLTLYTKFALIRMDQIEQIAATAKTGRATFIHDLLEDYTHIVEAMDTVADDALSRKVTIDKGVAAVASAEKDFLARLTKLRDEKPKDLARYEFALRDAIDTTGDSLELSNQDLEQRTGEVTAKQKKEQEERMANMRPEEVAAEKEKKAEAQRVDVNKRKRPSLLKPGETVPEVNGGPAPAKTNTK